MEALLFKLLELGIENGPAVVQALTQMFAAAGKTKVTQADWDALHAIEAQQTAVIDADIPGENDV